MEITSDGGLVATTQGGLAPFALYRPRTLSEARAAMSSAPRPVALYAGGTDFFASVREGLQPASLIWLAGIAELSAAEADADWLTLGSGLSHEEAVRHPALVAVPGLAQAWGRIATVRIRRHATLGGNLMARRPRYELSILLSALCARARLATSTGMLELPVEALWDLDEPALLISVAIPLAGAPRLDYARDLRPLCTQALCLRAPAASRLPERRLAVATEHLRPWITEPAPGAAPEEVFAALPSDFADPAAGRGWLARAGAAQYERQRARLEAVP